MYYICRNFKKMEEKKPFNKGDIIVKKTVKGWFAIYEGNLVPGYGYQKKYSLIAVYDPEKYQKMENGEYAKAPFFANATKFERCPESIDECNECYWYGFANEDDIKYAQDVLLEHGLRWDAENFRLLDVNTGEVVREIVMPKTQYSGAKIHVSRRRLREIHEAIESKTPITRQPPYDQRYGYWDDMMD